MKVRRRSNNKPQSRKRNYHPQQLINNEVKPTERIRIVRCYYPNCEKEATGTRTQNHLASKEAGHFCSEHMKWKYDPGQMVNNVEEMQTNTCSFFTRDQQNNWIACDKPLFDKKKWLCRSHNRQVRQKFNEFIRGQSISSSAGWEMAWEQSGDWKCFWASGESGSEKKNE